MSARMWIWNKLKITLEMIKFEHTVFALAVRSDWSTACEPRSSDGTPDRLDSGCNGWSPQRGNGL